jgi:transcriptional regulator with XRE-family HTH domain
MIFEVSSPYQELLQNWRTPQSEAKSLTFNLLYLLIGKIQKFTMETIGNKIRIQRLIKNYSQHYMSFMLDISQAAYSNIESDKTELTLNRIYLIAEILEVSPFSLMPPPRFSLGINLGRYLRTLFHFRRVYNPNLREKREEAERLQIVYRDISKNLD